LTDVTDDCGADDASTVIQTMIFVPADRFAVRNVTVALPLLPLDDFSCRTDQAMPVLPG
jgi:hypothetical protein